MTEPALQGAEAIGQDETLSLISAEKVRGTAVYGAGAERLGEIETLMIDKRRGVVTYAVLAYGGILGFGARRYPLPWAQLHYDTELEGYVTGLTLADLEAAPSYGEGEPVDLADLEWGERVHSYYGPAGVRPGL